MSEPSSSAVSMRKAPRFGGTATGGTRAVRPPIARVTPPLTIMIAVGAMVVMAIGGVVRGVLLNLADTATLQRYVITQNNKAKNPSRPFDAVHGVYDLRQGAYIQAAIFGVALLLLAWALTRTRSASATRWAVLVIFIYTGLPFSILPSTGLVGSVQAVGIITGIAAIAALILIFGLPASQKYFRDCRDASTPPELRGQARPGLGSLFKPRPAGAARGGARGGAARPSRNAQPDTRPVEPKAKAKVRVDPDGVAKGAELARSRAKAASKSRRTSD